jgi:3-oxoacyl-[acyl-carrier protein] reductase
MISLTGKAALVTGGSRGIGAATVKLLAQAGADVVFSYRRRKDAARQVEQEAGRHGTRVEAMQVDLRVAANSRKLVDFAIERLGRLDIVVANSGIWNVEDIPIGEMDEHAWDDMMRSNLRSVYALAHFAVPTMIAQHGGRFIAISSTSGQRGEAFHSHYSASKGAVISFVKSLASELARHNILVNCVAPGWVYTDMVKPTMATKTGRKFVMKQIPLGRLGTPEEIAGSILFLASDLATFITGEILNVNGGAVLCG